MYYCVTHSSRKSVSAGLASGQRLSNTQELRLAYMGLFSRKHKKILSLLTLKLTLTCKIMLFSIITDNSGYEREVFMHVTDIKFQQIIYFTTRDDMFVLNIIY